jgi:VIT1/CCC1 family predicted Fe2+/Mn2+ transporter
MVDPLFRRRVVARKRRPDALPEARSSATSAASAVKASGTTLKTAIALQEEGCVARRSIHVEPHGTVAVARHYIRDLVYGANDGIITTFAVVAGVAGGALSHTTVLIVGAANLAADGLSMAVGNFLAIRANESAREAQQLPEEEAHPWKHGAATFLAFVIAGSLPLAPYLVPQMREAGFWWSSLFTLVALFGVGAARTTVTVDRWWAAGLEMLLLGLAVALVAYGAGALISGLAT